MKMIRIFEFMANELGAKQPYRQGRWLILAPDVYAVSGF